MKFSIQLLLCALPVLACASAQAATREWTPQSESEVVEQLPERVRPPAATPQAAADAARRWIMLARRNADPRYLGRAQAALARWWDRPDAPTELAVLQATVQQSRHEFDAARKTLQGVLAREPAQAQGWLTLATLERLSGRYDAAAQACSQVQRAGAALYAAACTLENRSLLGDFDKARQGYQSLAQQAGDASTRAWLLSLLAESEERAGRDPSANTAYQSSLKLAPDGYTALAYADLLLRLSQPAEALRILADQPPSDAVLIRQGQALKLKGDPGWKAVRSELTERFAALDARGEDSTLHARERALAALWLDDTPDTAWRYAQANLGLQKEPLDWWLALSAAQAGGRSQDISRLQQALRGTGLKDARLARWQTAQKS
jgi:tetratricopeptide (TPR) repeat protein